MLSFFVLLLRQFCCFRSLATSKIAVNKPTDPVDVEQKLEWTQLHVDYRRKFEDRANAVLANAGYDVDQVILELTKFVKSIYCSDTQSIYILLMLLLLLYLLHND